MVYYILDMDGVLVEYRWQDKINMTNKELQSKGNFLSRNPVPNIINILKLMNKSGQVSFHILSVSPNEEMDEEKKQWAKRHTPFIPQNNIHFVRHSNEKGDYLEELFQVLKIDHNINYKENLIRKSILMIDDTHSILYEIENRGFIAWHPTTLLNRFYHNMHYQLSSTTVM